MRNSAIVSMALMATSALAKGTAYVKNECSYPVHMQNTPAAGGGYDMITDVLETGDTYSQDWTELGNGMGWSIKLSETGTYQSNLMQYEYTFHNDGTIWYDMSEVDGNPWSGNWMIDADGSCSPRQAAYRHPTDDAYGMQSCSDTASITLTLCSSDAGAGTDDGYSGSSSSASPSDVAPSSTDVAPSSTDVAPSSTADDEMPAYTPSETPEATSIQSEESEPEQTGGWGHYTWGYNADKGVVQAAAETTAAPTTLMTKASDATVTNYATEVVTAIVTEVARAKRHKHHVRHPHQRREE